MDGGIGGVGELEAGDSTLPLEAFGGMGRGVGYVYDFVGLEEGVEVAVGFGGGIGYGSEGGYVSGILDGFAGCEGEMDVGGAERGLSGVGEEWVRRLR